MTAEETGEVLRLMFGAFPSQRSRMGDDQIKTTAAVYGLGLGDLEVAQVRAAVIRLVRTAKFFPTIAEIRAEVGIVASGAVMAGAEQWGAVRRAIGRYGVNREPGVDFVFGDETTARAVAALGWRDLCLSDSATADRARFIEAYDAIEKTTRREAQASEGATVRRLKPTREAISAVHARLALAGEPRKDGDE